jgi:FdhE protein
LNVRVEDARWQRRATRARRLASEHPAVAETLYFYADLAETQEALLHRFPALISTPASSFADRLDPGAALKALPELFAFIRREAPAALANELAPLRDDEYDRWTHRIHTYWITGGRESWDASPIQRFVLEALLQPFAERAVGNPPADRPSASASARVDPARATADRPSAPSSCDLCTGVPVAALLREQGHGSKRSLVCGLCLSEWSSPRLECLHCGESRFESLPVYRSDEFEAVRIDACDSCQSYVKTIDLTRDGDASPIVDDLASLPLDVWARDRGYRRVRPNLFGI